MAPSGREPSVVFSDRPAFHIPARLAEARRQALSARDREPPAPPPDEARQGLRLYQPPISAPSVGQPSRAQRDALRAVLHPALAEDLLARADAQVIERRAIEGVLKAFEDRNAPDILTVVAEAQVRPANFKDWDATSGNLKVNERSKPAESIVRIVRAAERAQVPARDTKAFLKLASEIGDLLRTARAESSDTRDHRPLAQELVTLLESGKAGEALSRADLEAWVAKAEAQWPEGGPTRSRMGPVIRAARRLVEQLKSAESFSPPPVEDIDLDATSRKLVATARGIGPKNTTDTEAGTAQGELHLVLTGARDEPPSPRPGQSSVEPSRGCVPSRLCRGSGAIPQK